MLSHILSLITALTFLYETQTTTGVEMGLTLTLALGFSSLVTIIMPTDFQLDRASVDATKNTCSRFHANTLLTLYFHFPTRH